MPSLIAQAIDLARQLQRRANELQTPQEKRQQAELDRMLRTPSDKATLVQLTDQSFRATSPARIADQFTHILDVQGVPRFFSPVDRALLRGFQTFGGWLPDVAVPMMKGHMQHETANVILPAEPELLNEHLRKRRAQSVRMNVNFLGEAVLSEPEAGRRLVQYLEAMQSPETEVFSVKISTLYSQMSPLAREHTISVISDRLERLYRSAARATFIREDGTAVPKFIYLDMEEYRDLSLTCEIFMRTLARDGLQQVRAGIALQAYIPDSFRWQQSLNEWARQRVRDGGGEITIRLVKGANMEMERVEASLKNWPPAPYQTKVETDANYKRMLHEAMRPDNLAAVSIGVASHNLFDVAYGLVLARENQALDRVHFEMLEGMANPQRRALLETTERLLLYAPVCHKRHFLSAIGYLIRRLDENTGAENFLRHSFKLVPGSPEWNHLEQGFRAAFARLPSLTDAPRRTQDRRKGTDGSIHSPHPAAPPNHVCGDESPPWSRFRNEPDTDWALPHHAEWAEGIVAKWRGRCDDHAPEVPLLVDGKDIFEERQAFDCRDPSRPGVVAGRYRHARASDVQDAISCAAADPDGWRTMAPAKRDQVLRQVAREFRQARADLMGAALANTGKVLAESDPEVSEAIDFVEFYSATGRWFAEGLGPDIRGSGKGVAVVVSPWNFPIAIPTGGIAAALAAGNTVIFKPSSDAILPAWELCQCFWRGGVSPRTLQFLPCSGTEEGSQLVQQPEVKAVILTGGTATAQAMLRAKPTMPLTAETGGKNATIVTAIADRDQAIKNVLHSAFSHGGQKCSATSLLLLEAELYDDPEFKRALVEAAESIRVGSAWDLATRMGPLIRPPRGDLRNALLTLEAGESWVLMPQRLEGNDCLWSPGIKWDVRPGSATHLTEFFGPVLGVMRFNKLSDAISLVNATGYGLTSGLESLDDREQAEWQAAVRAGNLYINRSTVGAIVLRQPFGGMGKSNFGAGLKAGGPNYVAQFMEFHESAAASEVDSGTASAANPEAALAGILDAAQRIDGIHRLRRAVASYERAWNSEFSRTHDTFRLIGQDNLRRYLTVREMRLRIDPADSAFEIWARAAAARIARCRITVSVPPGHLSVLKDLHDATEVWAGEIEFIEETDAELAAVVARQETDRVRFAHPQRVPVEVRRAAAEAFVFIADAPVLMEGRVELLWYLREQSVSSDYHRYGNLGARVEEVRAEMVGAE